MGLGHIISFISQTFSAFGQLFSRLYYACSYWRHQTVSWVSSPMSPSLMGNGHNLTPWANLISASVSSSQLDTDDFQTCVSRPGPSPEIRTHQFDLMVIRYLDIVQPPQIQNAQICPFLFGVPCLAIFHFCSSRCPVL